MVLIASFTILLLNGRVYLIVGENQIVLQLLIGKFKVLLRTIILECFTFILVYTVLFYILISQGATLVWYNLCFWCCPSPQLSL